MLRMVPLPFTREAGVDRILWPPCQRGLAAVRLTGGFRSPEVIMHYKHNPALTQFAKQLRREMTREEKHLWYDFLRGYPIRFLRQKVIDNYIADFYCHAAQLVIELDGSQHYEDSALLKDRIRTRKLETYGLTVLRIPNIDVNRNFTGVCEYIDEYVHAALMDKG